MPSLVGWRLDRFAIPVDAVSDGGGGDWGAPIGSVWQAVGDPIPVRILDMDSEEKFRAGLDVAVKTKKVYFGLVNGKAPFSEAATLDLSDTATPSGERFNVTSILEYNQPKFPKAGKAIMTRK